MPGGAASCASGLEPVASGERTVALVRPVSPDPPVICDRCRCEAWIVERYPLPLVSPAIGQPTIPSPLSSAACRPARPLSLALEQMRSML